MMRVSHIGPKGNACQALKKTQNQTLRAQETNQTNLTLQHHI